MIELIAVCCSALGALLAIPRAISETRRLINEFKGRPKKTSEGDN